MASIVDAYAAVGLPLAYFPLDATDPGLEAETGGQAQEIANIGSGAGPFINNVASFGGVDSRIGLDNSSDLFDGRDVFSIAGRVFVNGSSTSHRYLTQIRTAAGVELAYVTIPPNLSSIRAMARSQSSDSSTSATISIAIDAWVQFSVSFFPYANRIIIRAAAAQSVINRTSDSDTVNWELGRPLHVGSNFSNSVPFDGRLAHICYWDQPISQSQHDAMVLADSDGLNCVVDLPLAEVYQIDGVEQAAVGDWEYRLFNDASLGSLYARGADFTILSSAAATTFFVPAAGDYYLVLRDPTTGKAHAQTVPLVAA